MKSLVRRGVAELGHRFAEAIELFARGVLERGSVLARRRRSRRAFEAREEPEITLAAEGGEHALLGALALALELLEDRPQGSPVTGGEGRDFRTEVIEHDVEVPCRPELAAEPGELLAEPFDPTLIEHGRGGLQNGAQPA